MGIIKHKGFVEIDRPIALVMELFLQPDGRKAYQDGFVKAELQSGQAGEAGAVSKLYYTYGTKDMVLTETIIRNNLPDAFEAFYHHKHMDNTMKCRFEALSSTRTKYEYAFEYTRMNWLIPKLTALLLPGMYRKQGDKWMQQFKTFVEQH